MHTFTPPPHNKHLKRITTTFLLFCTLLAFTFALSSCKNPASSATDNIANDPEIITKADIVFLIDITGSMASLINETGNFISTTLLQELSDRKIDFQIAAIAFMDITNVEDNNKPHIITTWTKDPVPALSTIKRGKGGDGPETQLDALGFMMDKIAFRSNSYRFAFVITDATSKLDNDYGYKNEQEVADALKSREIITSFIGNSDAMYISISKKTGGLYTTGKTASAFSQTITDLIASHFN